LTSEFKLAKPDQIGRDPESNVQPDDDGYETRHHGSTSAFSLSRPLTSVASFADQNAVMSMGYPGKRIHTNARGKVNCWFSASPCHPAQASPVTPLDRTLERCEGW
jgi:hypothetical protein